MPPLHPLVIHFPIALFLVGVLFDGITMFTRKTNLVFAGKLLMILSFLGTLVALLTGDWLKQQRGSLLPHGLLKWHEWLAVGFAIWLAVLLLIRLHKFWIPTKRYMGMAVVGVILLTAVGHTGGSMAWPSLGTPPVAVNTQNQSTAADTGNAADGNSTAANSSGNAAGDGTANTASNQTSGNKTASSTAGKTTTPSTTTQKSSTAGSGSTSSHTSTPAPKPKTDPNQVLLTDGKTYFIQSCQSCHSLYLTERYFGQLTPQEWTQVVYNMQARGAQINNQQANDIIYYLEHQK